MHDWITITSKFTNKCITCGNIIEIGEKILWKKGSGIRHINPCEEAESLQPDNSALIIIDEWVDMEKHKDLTMIKQCQKCGIMLRGNDIYNNLGRRTCEECFIK